jgi:hypothetical protein
MDMKMRVVTGMIGVCLGLSSSAEATTTGLAGYSNPGGACQLSIPTTDTQVRPKASGYRNEGTQSAFVICGYSKSSYTDFQNLVIGLTSMDGAAHAVSCTVVTGLNGNASSPLIYSTATITATADGAMTNKVWTPADFGSSGSEIPGSYEPSVTYALPAKVAIVYLSGRFEINIGA